MEKCITESRLKELQGLKAASNNFDALQEVDSVGFFNGAATETVPSVEYPEFEFLLKYDMFASGARGKHKFITR